MDRLNLYSEESFNRTDQLYSFDTDSTLEFFSADEPGKLRGPSRSILFLNEANLIGYESFLQLNMRTVDTIFLDLNPSDLISWSYDVSDRETSKLLISTYKDNEENLSRAQIEEIEALRHADENLWKVYGLGLRGVASELILTHWKICEYIPEGEVFYGLDFGFNHPTALIKITLYDDVLYAQEILYQSKLTTSDLVEKFVNDFDIPHWSEIYADSAMPGTIEELSRQNFNILPAKKDVIEGLRFLKSKKLFIHKDSTNLIKELRSYRWKLNAAGKPYDEPTKFMDDGIDALRYACYTQSTQLRATWVAR